MNGIGAQKWVPIFFAINRLRSLKAEQSTTSRERSRSELLPCLMI